MPSSTPKPVFDHLLALIETILTSCQTGFGEEIFKVWSIEVNFTRLI